MSLDSDRDRNAKRRWLPRAEPKGWTSLDLLAEQEAHLRPHKPKSLCGLSFLDSAFHSRHRTRRVQESRLQPRLLREPAAPAMSIFEYNGSAVVAMVGKNCFAIASDRRLGVQLQTIATDFKRVFKIHDKLYIGLSGLATDAQTLYQRLVFRHKLYQLREERDMKPQTFASLVSALLYEKRFGPYFCQPVIAGLGEDNEPFICTMDCIGAKELAKDFVVSGTASESLYGACESMYKPNMEPDELFETISQALLSSVDRDCLSGWGGYVLLVTPTEVQERVLKSRMD
ncbi:hypothetical protein GUJ93_ZPchr0006g45219 [Zizania palustris]|uniref:Proteasome subunit beta n=1 Tax=Zizania palustris TaxID=103762 RepID=A0A8J5VWQ5_ZIZPA|nr:hypothetical protein GUJ93_ZPchr0006g45219 [Zizania palustris]